MSFNKFHSKDYRFLQIMKALINGIPVYSKNLKENIWLSEDMAIVVEREQIITFMKDGETTSRKHSKSKVFIPVLLDNPLKLIHDIANDISDEEFAKLSYTIALNEL